MADLGSRLPALTHAACPVTGCQKLIEVDDELKLCTSYEQHVATKIAADALGEEWKGYMVQISGGNDKHGFPMKQMPDQDLPVLNVTQRPALHRPSSHLLTAWRDWGQHQQQEQGEVEKPSGVIWTSSRCLHLLMSLSDQDRHRVQVVASAPAADAMQLSAVQAQAGWLQQDLGHLSVFSITTWNPPLHHSVIAHLNGAPAS
ncbi:hypothetical protein QTO34_002875 [Cnephaeus nilssonii]|uniref:Small ribosomal subunit protein eS6 n=1 Tax=Cnephaeus nilssonii TaxID=3371016 RepID=A0AA40LL08_CNENI|nr:hypothetical protein QTO34_002875 [Eptesicus nilssonii]